MKILQGSLVTSFCCCVQDLVKIFESIHEDNFKISQGSLEVIITLYIKHERQCFIGISKTLRRELEIRRTIKYF